MTPTLNDIEKMHDYIAGRMVSACVYVAAKLKIADYLKDGPQPIEMIAKNCNTNVQALARLMRALVGLGVFKKSENQTYELASLGTTLLSESKTSMRDLILMCGDRWHWDLWGGLDYSIKFECNMFSISVK